MTQSTKVTDKKAARQEQVKHGMGDVPFYASMVFIFALIVPFNYYAYQCYLWGHENKPEGYDYVTLEDFKYTFVSCMYLFAQKKIIHMLFFKKMHEEWCKKQSTELLTYRYASKATESIPKLIFFYSSVTCGWFVLKDSKWLPWFLGGQHPEADFFSVFEMNYVEAPKGVKMYALFTYGYHVQECLDHMFFKERQSDYREMLLHHIATAFLYPGYLMANFTGVGAVLSFLHDISDCFISTSRFFNSIGRDTLTTIFYFLIMITWM